MKIDEAIKMLHSLQGETPEQLATPMQQALKLGIEALKEHQRIRRKGFFTKEMLLPGETEEVEDGT